MDLTKMGMIQLQNPCHPTGLLHKANQMRLAGTLCDVVIMVDSQEFHAHRTVLACTSKMFEILFHRNSQHYTLDFLSPKTFQQILEYAYTATLQAKVEDLDDLLYAAEILEIEYLEEQCLKILETIQASEDNDAEVAMPSATTATTQDGKPLGIYSLLPNHKTEPVLGVPPSVASALHVQPALAVSMDFSAYGGLLPQGFIQRELFSKLGELAAGMKTESRALGEQCSVCGAELPDNETLEQHRKLHSGMKTYGCELCGKRFLDSLRLRMHLLAHSAGAKALVCDQCGAQFSKEDALETHRQTHTGTDMAVFCLLCGKRFQTQSALQQHMEVHAGVRSYICSECNRTFPSHTALKRHLRSHTGFGIAGSVTPSPLLAGLALRSVSWGPLSPEDPGVRTWPFSACCAASGSRRRAPCSSTWRRKKLCGRRSQTQGALQQHMEVHAGVRSYICSECNRTFPSHTALKRHLRSHTGTKPFECKLCHQRSRDYSAMIKHLRTHNGASPYQCTICLEYCPSLSAMQKHMKGHKPEEIPTDWRIEKTYLYLCYV
ncbi:PREDICTED: zinc finger and BTB domain-containing protein 16 [Charadrius vociferus]|uniref:zinc finger and BTB domain-containing protein 16 n=1 Tax=Charadrius vociferus TaxID=50402 RepID=UPI000521374E|nr:PREDICTED: zinc finger and BTB domain-containing protein 16 [Charadrius vociferus]